MADVHEKCNRTIVVFLPTGVLSALDRIRAAGFRPAGHWSLANGVLRLNLAHPHPAVPEHLYAIAANGDLTYIGKTTQGLLKRMQAYRSPPSGPKSGGLTNIKNHQNITAALAAGQAVEIYVLDAAGEQRHGEFRVNFAAGLEDSLIRELAPPWNGRGRPIEPAPERAIAAPLGRARSARPIHWDRCPRLPIYCRSAATGKAPRSRPLRGREFSVEVVGNVLHVTPASSGQSRPVPKANLVAVLARLAELDSQRSADYQDITFHASYVLSMLHEWRRSADVPAV